MGFSIKFMAKSPFAKIVTKSFLGREYKATESGIPVPEKTDWGKMSKEERQAYRDEQTRISS